MITLKNCRLIPELTEDYDDVMADILLDGKVIREINAPGTGTKGETVMDLEGKTVMPGLFDLHMHFNFDTVNVYELRARGESQALLNGISYGYQYLRVHVLSGRLSAGRLCQRIADGSPGHHSRRLQQSVRNGQQRLRPRLQGVQRPS